mmetsp:Transcript_29412/g.68197  ORF Transcript_29412/g.68197 Transcript_29412/m.68197 type:complete len:140 (+) Transcript_29412:166-585(+)
MKPAWEDLGTEYKDSASVLIGDADCTVEADLCSKHGVRGYPTIKYFTAETGKEGKDYSGGRSLPDLKKFVSENLEAKCDPSAPKDCTEKEVKFIEQMKAKSEDERAKQIERLEKMKGGSMKPELKQWLLQRLAILRQLK